MIGSKYGEFLAVYPRVGGAATRMTEARFIVLVGLMGAGKTSLGKRLAKELKLPFVDTDTEIEKAANMSIPEIFEKMGEAEFRAGERRVIARVLEGGPCVIATGGGAFMDPGTRALIAGKALSVWLRADLDTLVRRTKRRDDRPLLKAGDPREVLRRLIEERYPIYAEADITLDVDDDPPKEMVVRLKSAIEDRTGQPRSMAAS
jgi:shikimate kinase